MPRALLASFANRLAIPDLRWMPDEGLTMSRLRIELLSGLTVGLALVPEAVAFAFVAGVHPLVGLVCRVPCGSDHCSDRRPSRHDLGCNRCSGRGHGGVGGAARGRIPVRDGCSDGHPASDCGGDALGAVHPAGAASGDAGLCERTGHCDFLAQMGQFKVPGTMENTGHGMAGGEWLSGMQLYTMLGLVALTMAVIWVMPRITRIVPAPLWPVSWSWPHW